MDRPVEEAALTFSVSEARMYGSKVAVPRLGDPMDVERTVDGPTSCEVVLRARVASREEFLRWQLLVGRGQLEVHVPESPCSTRACGACWSCRARGVRA